MAMQSSLRNMVFVRLASAIALAVAIGALLIQTPSGQSAVYYVDVRNPGCSNADGFGSESRPYCTLNYASTIAKPGDTFLVKAGRYGDGPVRFVRSGTSTAPITYRAIGDAVIGSFEDVKDEDFKPAGAPHVYVAAWTRKPFNPARVHQTSFDPIVVDDPNQSIFTLKPEDGPLALSSVADDATLAAQEGTWRYDAPSALLYVHPYGNRVPSTAGTDFVVALSGGALVVETPVQYNVLDGFRVTYTGAASSFQVLGKNNRFLNLRIQGQTWSLRGSDNHAQNITITHVIVRGRTWKWYDSGDGTAMAVIGPNHRLTNVHIYHNWNSSIGGDTAPGLIIDGLRAHGAPNHCNVVGSDVTVRNAVLYNCQDYFYLHQTSNVLIEHSVNPSGISLQGISGPVGNVTVRNSILTGTFGYTSASKPEHCAWESNSLLENNVISSAATIERCADGRAYPITEYITNCQRGVFTGCMTIRNNQTVSDFRTVIKDGMWTAALGDQWDVTLVTNSPAIDSGTASGAARDLLGVLRPQGTAPDIGVYENCRSGCSSTPPTPGQVRVVR
jgi:hypothetical protein